MTYPLLVPIIALAAGVTSAAAQQPSANPLEPLAFLAGHCYKSAPEQGKDAPVRKDIDEHCFSWQYGGKVLRDVHIVRGPGHPDLAGESTYYWDSAVNKIAYLYIEDQGGYMRGTVEQEEGALLFPPAQFVLGGKALTLRTRWALLGDGYEAWAQLEGPKGWATLFRVPMVKSS
jgi:hypothetical protein